MVTAWEDIASRICGYNSVVKYLMHESKYFYT